MCRVMFILSDFLFSLSVWAQERMLQRRRLGIAFSLFLVCCAVNAQELFALQKSPDGRLCVNMQQQDDKTFLAINNPDGKELLRVRLGFSTKEDNFFKGLELASASKPQTKSVKYTNIHGKQRKVKAKYSQSVLSFDNAKNIPMQVEIRLFNDGLAFRYLLSNETKRLLEFTDEHTTYYLSAESHRWIQKFVTSYEGDFPYQERGGATGAWNYPALFEYDGTFILLTEANATRQYCTTHLDNSADANQYKVSFPFPFEGNGQGAVNPVWSDTWASPWRIAVVGELKDVVRSTLVDNVSDATAMTDLLWIKPGRAAWVYWAYNHGTKDYQICRQYVDLAAEMGWEYVLFDWEWDQMTNGGKLEDAVAYARSKGIKPWMWYNSGGSHTGVRSTPLDRMLTHENRVKEFTWLKSLGVVGVKVDFFESDKQQMIAYYLDILEDAAKFQVMVNFHGCTLPRGWSRTYPHLMSQEAVYGAEQYNNAPYMTDNGARINCLLPYTRNVVGPMDYTPVAFTHSQHPHKTSYVHELALSVAFESGVQHWADRPEGFVQLPDEAKQHMQKVPVVWDETHFVGGYPGESFVVARRSGSTWYVAGLNGQNTKQDFRFQPDFLSKGMHEMTVYADGADKTAFAISHRKVKATEPLSFTCLPQGGFLLIFN